MGGKKTPDAPDYKGAAQAQGEANKEAALQTAVLSNPNIITPYGSQTVTWGYPSGGVTPIQSRPPVNAGPRINGAVTTPSKRYPGQPLNDPPRYDFSTGTISYGDGTSYSGGLFGSRVPNGVAGVPQATVTQTLSPTEQQKYDKNSQLDISLLDTANEGLGRVNDMMDTPFDMSNLTQVSDVTGTNADPSLTTDGLQDFSGINTATLPEANGINTNGMVGYQGINTEGLTDFTSVDTGALSPQGEQINLDSLQGRTVEPTVGGFDRVYNAMMERANPQFERQREQLENDLKIKGFVPGTEAFNAEMDRVNRQQNDYSLAATAAAGDEQARMFGMESSAREQGLNEQVIASQMAQQLRAQGLNEQEVQARVNSAIRGQQFGERQTESTMNNQIRQSQFAERDRIANMEMALRAQGLSEQQVQAQVNAAIRSQQFGERGAMASFEQSEANRDLSEQLALQQATGQQRQQEIQEQAYLRSLPLNEINALRTGTQANLPQFQGYTGAQVNAAPIFDAAAARGNFDLANYQNEMAGMSGLFDLAGAGLGAAGAAGGWGPLFSMGGS